MQLQRAMAAEAEAAREARAKVLMMMLMRMMVRMMMRMMQEDQACSSLTVDIVGWAVQPGCRASNYDVDVLQEQCRARRSM